MRGIVRQTAVNRSFSVSRSQCRCLVQGTGNYSSKEMTVHDALNSALDEEMSADPKVLIMGEEVGEYQGAYNITKGLVDKYERVIDTPITEVASQSWQYRGKLDEGAVLKAICSGFEETTQLDVCLSEETNECLENNGGCWQDIAANIPACKDTFRGRVCQCPIVQGVKFSGDGYTYCEASGSLCCEINNGGCWRKTQNGRTYSACIDDHTKGCKCPPGFKGDGVNNCEGIRKDRMIDADDHSFSRNYCSSC